MRAAGGTALGVLAGLLAGAVAAQDATGDPQLDRMREAIEGSRERVGRFEREQRALFDRLEEIDRRLVDLEQRERRGRREAEVARVRAGELSSRAAEAAARLIETRRAMSRRVVALYKAGEVGPVKLLFAARSLRDFLTRASALRRVLADDARLVARYRSQSDVEELARIESAAAAARLQDLLNTLAADRRALGAEREAKRTLLAEVRQSRSAERALLIELERAARALEEAVARLGDERLGSGESLDGSGFASRRGRLLRPVAGRVLQPFGKVVDAEYLTETLRKGVELAAPAGDSVRAVAPGRVRFAGWFRGYGRLVILDHGDAYFSVFGHLDEIFVDVGARVEAGDTLGSAGETGSLAGPRLYFEVRHGSRPLDPEEWLAPR